MVSFFWYKGMVETPYGVDGQLAIIIYVVNEQMLLYDHILKLRLQWRLLTQSQS